VTDEPELYVIEQVTGAEFAELGPEEIMRARAEGRLAHVLGQSPAEANCGEPAVRASLPAAGQQWTRDQLRRAVTAGLLRDLNEARARGDLRDLAGGAA
jgi:hypothetical protein